MQQQQQQQQHPLAAQPPLLQARNSLYHYHPHKQTTNGVMYRVGGNGGTAASPNPSGSASAAFVPSAMAVVPAAAAAATVAGSTDTKEPREGGNASGSTTKLTAQQLELLQFWVPQLKEHALFIYSGLSPLPPVPVLSPLLADAAATSMPASTKTQVPVDTQLPTVDATDQVVYLKEVALTLFYAWTEFEKKVVMAPHTIVSGELTVLTSDLRRLKKDVLKLQEGKVWVGWLYPAFMEHILKELEYFVVNFNGELAKFKSDDERKNYKRAFWTEINADHAQFAAQLLNPSDDNLELIRNAVTSLAAEGKRQPRLPAIADPEATDLAQAVLLTRTFGDFDYAKRVDGFLSTAWNQGKPQLSSILHPLLIAHVVREGQQSIKELAEIGVKDGGSAQMYQQLQQRMGGGSSLTKPAAAPAYAWVPAARVHQPQQHQPHQAHHQAPISTSGVVTGPPVMRAYAPLPQHVATASPAAWK